MNFRVFTHSCISWNMAQYYEQFKVIRSLFVTPETVKNPFWVITLYERNESFQISLIMYRT